MNPLSASQELFIFEAGSPSDVRAFSECEEHDDAPQMPPLPQINQSVKSEPATSSSSPEASSHSEYLQRVTRSKRKALNTGKAVLEERKLKNRINSRILRAKHRDYLEGLKKEHTELLKTNESLKAQIQIYAQRDCIFQRREAHMQNTIMKLLAGVKQCEGCFSHLQDLVEKGKNEKN